MIKEPHGKTRAEVNFFSNTVNAKDLAETWCLPFIRDHLVRVTIGKCNLDELKAHNTHNRKLFNLPKNTNEVLLWRQVRQTDTESDDDKVLNSKNSAKEYQQKSAYLKRKSKEIKEGKRRAFFDEAFSSNTISSKPNMKYENSIDYMMQLIRSLKEKSNTWSETFLIAPNRHTS
ncbi:12413_t:CDS:2 [Cetraspora pellucida]|uniref:12413_t:CDS:1 n=1 Tax=Cetraspora pellucida TaxID=1433469 RepID=A0ACA9KKC5_9GLOM|nr:12413_t:CDS:2 [Cetraspora pellucida]